jgi:hypothetical protein
MPNLDYIRSEIERMHVQVYRQRKDILHDPSDRRRLGTGDNLRGRTISMMIAHIVARVQKFQLCFSFAPKSVVVDKRSTCHFPKLIGAKADLFF